MWLYRSYLRTYDRKTTNLNSSFFTMYFSKINKIENLKDLSFLRIHQLLVFSHKLLYQVINLFMVSLPVERLQNQLVVNIHFDNLSGAVVFNGRYHCFLKLDKRFLIFRRINQNLSPLLTLSQWNHICSYIKSILFTRLWR